MRKSYLDSERPNVKKAVEEVEDDPMEDQEDQDEGPKQGQKAATTPKAGEKIETSEPQNPDYESRMKQLMNWVTNDSVIGSVKSRSSQKSGSSQNTGVRLKPPTFDGKNEPKHFFVKLFNYLETYNIEGNEEKIRVLKSCLEGPALDLYLALPQKEQGDIKILERTFQSHFRPAGHNVVETGAFM